MRFGAILLAALALLAAGAANADEGEPDWVFEGEDYSDSYSPCDWDGYGDYDFFPDVPADFPWEQVAYGELRVYAQGRMFIAPTVPVRVTATCGDQVDESWTLVGPLCGVGEPPACTLHWIEISTTFTVYSPTSPADFHILAEWHIPDDYSGGGCGYGNTCDDSGEAYTTLSLYAHPTAITPSTFSAIKARY